MNPIRIGDRIFRPDKEEYIIARVDRDLFVLISLANGERWTNPTPIVTEHSVLKPKEFGNLSLGYDFYDKDGIPVGSTSTVYVKLNDESIAKITDDEVTIGDQSYPIEFIEKILKAWENL